jgi:hypothetical protein
MMKFALVFSIVFVFGLFIGAYLHERAHQSFYARDGIKSRIDMFGAFPDAQTIPERDCISKECVLLNGMNEIVGYNLQGLYWLVGMGLFVVIALLEPKKKPEVKEVSS